MTNGAGRVREVTRDIGEDAMERLAAAGHIMVVRRPSSPHRAIFRRLLVLFGVLAALAVALPLTIRGVIG